jgi:FtsH-binding integral membrane protein
MQVDPGELQSTFAAAMSRVYLWMFLGLLLTTATALFTVSFDPLLQLIFSSALIPIGLFVVEIGLVIAIGSLINRISPTTALVLFFAYAAINGLTLSVIFLAYSLGSIFLTFGVCALLFGFMSVIGFTTKQDLTGWGKILLIGLVGIIIASIVNFFLASTILEVIISYLGVAIFLGLTVYDTQRIRVMTAAGILQGDSLVVSRVGIMGALKLYLDFINLFLFLLRILGRRR